mmetsp:Transcript_14473/g.46370  ORF Transcript_14473/g.46370 Transcript_14473/m.46370 type:complete len:359 (+) Transcript_14473:98-1174(+)
MRVHVRLNHAAPFSVDVDPGDAVARLKEAIEGKIGVPVGEQRLYFAEQPLRDHCTLAECSVLGNCTLLLCRVAPGFLGVRRSRTLGGEASGPGAGDAGAGGRRAPDVQLELRVSSMTGEVLLAEAARSSRTIAQVKSDLEKRRGCPAAEQRLIGKEARVLQDDETLHDVACGEAVVHLQLIRITAERAKVLKDLARGRLHLRGLPTEMARDPQIMLAAIQGGSATFADAPEVTSDREAVLEILKSRGALFKELPPALRADPKLILAALECTRDAELLTSAPPGLREDRQFMLQAVSWAGSALRYASSKLQNERPIVLAAVANDGDALRHAGKALREDPVVQRTAAGNSARVLMKLIDA